MFSVWCSTEKYQCGAKSQIYLQGIASIAPKVELGARSYTKTQDADWKSGESWMVQSWHDLGALAKRVGCIEVANFHGGTCSMRMH